MIEIEISLQNTGLLVFIVKCFARFSETHWVLDKNSLQKTEQKKKKNKTNKNKPSVYLL